MKEFVVEAGDRSFRIGVGKLKEHGPEQLYEVVMEGEKKLVSAVSVSPAHLSLLVDNLSHNVEVRREGEYYLVSIEGENYSFLVREAAGTAPAATPPVPTEAVITAPMPGMVIEVFIRPGDKIDPNAKLLVLEAMKMQNEISSPRKGEIIRVSVKPGDSVKVGDELVLIS